LEVFHPLNFVAVYPILVFLLSSFVIYQFFFIIPHNIFYDTQQTGEGEEKSNADCAVKIKLIAPPMYVMTCMTLDKELGLETMNQCIEAIATVIRAKGYDFFKMIFRILVRVSVLMLWNTHFTSLVCYSCLLPLSLYPDIRIPVAPWM
jgi:hypothetical protein